MVTMPVMAAEQPELPTKVQDIANGSDDIYGEGVPIEHGTNPDERFSSGGADHTHKYIVANALIILSNDRGNSTFNVSAKYCYAAHESRLRQNDRCKRFTLCLVLTVRFRSLAPWGKLFQLFI